MILEANTSTNAFQLIYLGNLHYKNCMKIGIILVVHGSNHVSPRIKW